MAFTPAPTPASTSTSSSAPTPKPVANVASKPKPVANVAAKPKAEEPATTATTTDTSDEKKNRALWIGLSVAAVVVALSVPILCKVCGSEEEKEEEEEKKVASSGAVLNKLVNWVKELTEGDHEEEAEAEEEQDTEASKYVEIDSVMDFATTQSM